MNLKVIAEGVETQQQLEMLRELSNEVAIQGYLISKPLPLAEIDVFFEASTGAGQTIGWSSSG